MLTPYGIEIYDLGDYRLFTIRQYGIMQSTDVHGKIPMLPIPHNWQYWDDIAVDHDFALHTGITERSLNGTLTESDKTELSIGLKAL